VARVCIVLDYSTAVTRLLTLLACALVAGPARAAPPASEAHTVAGVALPARAGDQAARQARAARLASAAAARLGARVVRLPVPPGIAPRLERARALLLGGDIDAAAATYDAALADAARRPDAGGAEVVAGHVARAQIALARGEAALADALLGRLLRWDGGFAPTADEATPAVSEALARVAGGDGARAALAADDAGEVCRAVDLLIVVRRTADGRDEVARVDHCRVVATAVAPAGGDDAAVLDALVGAPAAAARPDHLLDRQPAPDRPLLARPWLWVAIGAVAVTAVAGGIWLSRDAGEDGFDVAIRF
jgi:hypothetical protein